MQGICFYTKTEEEPPKLDGYSLYAWDIWNSKELLGESVMNIKLERFNQVEKELLIEVLTELEILALKYELKQPKTCLGGL